MTRLLLAVGLLLPAIGCSTAPQPDYGKLGLVEVAGTVYLDGEPVPDAAVFFVEDDERYCFGMTDDRGRYTMMLNSDKSGVTPGEKRVEFSTVRNPLGAAAGVDEDPDAAPTEKTEQFASCYTGKGSPVEVEIDGADSSLDFYLSSDCSDWSVE